MCFLVLVFSKQNLLFLLISLSAEGGLLQRLCVWKRAC